MGWAHAGLGRQWEFLFCPEGALGREAEAWAPPLTCCVTSAKSQHLSGPPPICAAASFQSHPLRVLENEFVAGPAFVACVLRGERSKKRGKPQPLSLTCCRRCWATEKGLAEARTAFSLLCLPLLPHICPPSQSPAEVEVLSAHHLC